MYIYNFFPPVTIYSKTFSSIRLKIKPVWPESDIRVHPVLSAESENWRAKVFHGRRVAGCLHPSLLTHRQAGDESREERLLLVQLPGGVAEDCRLELLMISHHHQLPEAQLQGDQSFRLDTL